MCSYFRTLGQSLINSFVTLLHHDQFTGQLQTQRVLYMKKHKPLCPVADSIVLSLSASVAFEEGGEAVSPIPSNDKRDMLLLRWLHVSLNVQLHVVPIYFFR